MNSMFHSAFTYFSGVHAPVVSNVTNQSPVDGDVDKAMLLSTNTQMCRASKTQKSRQKCETKSNKLNMMF